MSEPPSSEPLSEREAFENGYYYFIEALKILAMPANKQCETMGNYNTAWELRDEVGAAECLLRSPSSDRLSESQRQGISELLAVLRNVPVDILPGGAQLENNYAAMSHASWEPLREQAKSLIELLAPATDACFRYLNITRDIVE